MQFDGVRAGVPILYRGELGHIPREGRIVIRSIIVAQSVPTGHGIGNQAVRGFDFSQLMAGFRHGSEPQVAGARRLAAHTPSNFGNPMIPGVLDYTSDPNGRASLHHAGTSDGPFDAFHHADVSPEFCFHASSPLDLPRLPHTSRPMLTPVRHG
ncbi:MAG TPA: hypothetical protein VK196_18625 [Magnetospirillum sp.]|nr:hypothetical protein [Magnetospirillum sp.]